MKKNTIPPNKFQRVNTELAQMREDFPFKNSPQSLTFENEIKRIATEREEPINQTINTLSKMSGVTVRHIYNYRNGKTDIPSGLIPIFCKQFNSNALAMSILTQCETTEEFEGFDLVKLVNKSGQYALGVHGHFLEIFEDDKVTGYELNESKRLTAGAIAVFHRLDQIVEDAYNRNRVNS